MPLTITIDPTSGRISPKGTNVVIPPENAGIGDLIYGTRSNFRVIGRGTAVEDENGRIDGRSIFGGIYGFVNGETMVVAPNELAASYWGNYVSGMPIIEPGNVLMRNGKKTSYYAQMNTKQNSNYIKGGSSIPLLLEKAYQATSLTKDTFMTDTSDEAKEVRRHFATWDEYIRQTLRVQGAPGSPFGAVTTNVKVHEFGRWMGKTFGASQPTDRALGRCYNYGNGGGEWWLPSMFELGEMMIDEHLDKLNKNPSSVFGSISADSDLWSCVFARSGYAWQYRNFGVSDHRGISAYRFVVRPVTLFKLK